MTETDRKFGQMARKMCRLSRGELDKSEQDRHGGLWPEYPVVARIEPGGSEASKL